MYARVLRLLLVFHASAVQERRLLEGGIFSGELDLPKPTAPPPPAPPPAPPVTTPPPTVPPHAVIPSATAPPPVASPPPTRLPTAPVTPPPAPRKDKNGKILPTPVPTLKGFKKCPAGTVQRLRSATGALITEETVNVCEACPSGRFAMFGWTKCLECLAGRYGVGGSHSVICTQKCPGGRYGLEGSKSVLCSGPCPAGRFGMAGASNARCTAPCPAGRFGFAGSASPGT
jgi:hypothetical protein